MVERGKFERFTATEERLYRNPKRTNRHWDPPTLYSVGMEVHFRGKNSPPSRVGDKNTRSEFINFRCLDVFSL